MLYLYHFTAQRYTLFFYAHNKSITFFILY
nr:MAG TPA: hypothetical protein [Caudoviricetes sp.]